MSASLSLSEVLIIKYKSHVSGYQGEGRDQGDDQVEDGKTTEQRRLEPHETGKQQRTAEDIDGGPATSCSGWTNLGVKFKVKSQFCCSTLMAALTAKLNDPRLHPAVDGQT